MKVTVTEANVCIGVNTFRDRVLHRIKQPVALGQKSKRFAFCEELGEMGFFLSSQSLPDIF